jgi:hypothetical protein
LHILFKTNFYTRSFVILEEQRTATRIPIIVTHTPSPSTRSYSIDPERRTDFTEKCLICDRYFNDPLVKRICSECNYKIYRPESNYEVTSRPTSHSRTTNIYPSAYTHGFPPILPSKPKTTARAIIRCPHCKNQNMTSDGMTGLDYHCSVCRNVIPAVYL